MVPAPAPAGAERFGERVAWVLSLGSFLESTTWMLTMQAQTVIGLGLRSQDQLVGAMGACSSISAMMQVRSLLRLAGGGGQAPPNQDLSYTTVF